jgi:hypothetical protein
LVKSEPVGNILIWEYPVLGFFGLPVSHWRAVLRFYDRALNQLVLARETARITQAALACAGLDAGTAAIFRGKYETGERRLDVAEFVGIARAVGADALKMLRAVEKGQ